MSNAGICDRFLSRSWRTKWPSSLTFQPSPGHQAPAALLCGWSMSIQLQSSDWSTTRRTSSTPSRTVRTICLIRGRSRSVRRPKSSSRWALTRGMRSRLGRSMEWAAGSSQCRTRLARWPCSTFCQPAMWPQTEDWPGVWSRRTQTIRWWSARTGSSTCPQLIPLTTRPSSTTHSLRPRFSRSMSGRPHSRKRQTSRLRGRGRRTKRRRTLTRNM